jgi:hypothetical protein
VEEVFVMVVRKGKIPSLDPKPWIGRMKGVPCFILGNGPSLNNVNVSLLDDYFTVGINRIFYKYDPTVLIWQDLALWIQEQNKVMKTKAVKYCREGSETRGGFYTFKLGHRDPKITHDISMLHGRGSSGTITYEFVWALGCDPIICVGMDCAYDGKLTDFYGDNPMHKPHTLPNCKRGLKFMIQNALGRTIINCSNTKILGPQQTLEEAIETLGEKKYDREMLVNMLMGVSE